jgi:uncharacterized membrane protein
LTALAAATAGDTGRRIAAIDVARGAAILAMVAYHLSFDLYLFGYVDWPVSTAPAWRGFAAAIASTFLFLAGVGLVLAHGERIRWRAFARRLAIIALAAAAVTGISLLAMPAAPVLFGILHAIALFSLFGLAFVRVPVPVTLAAAALVTVLPFVWRSPAFDGLALVWVGLGERRPPSMDYEPLFPWFGVTLLGIAFARTFRDAFRRAAAPPVRAKARDAAPGGTEADCGGPARREPSRLTPPIRALSWAGRRSLIIYLVHQPVLFALLYTVLAVTGPPAGPWSRDFMAECEETCIARGAGPAACAAQCTCARDEIVRRGLVPPPAIAGGQLPPSQTILSEIAAICRPS